MITQIHFGDSIYIGNLDVASLTQFGQTTQAQELDSFIEALLSKPVVELKKPFIVLAANNRLGLVPAGFSENQSLWFAPASVMFQKPSHEMSDAYLQRTTGIDLSSKPNLQVVR